VNHEPFEPQPTETIISMQTMKFLQSLVFLVCTFTALAAAAPVDADHAPAYHGKHHDGHHGGYYPRDVDAIDEEKHHKHHHDHHPRDVAAADEEERHKHHNNHHSRDVAASDEEENRKHHHHDREVSDEEDYRGHSAGYHDEYGHDGYHHSY